MGEPTLTRKTYLLLVAMAHGADMFMAAEAVATTR